MKTKTSLIRSLLNQGKTIREIAFAVYVDQTERGQRRVRAIASKLRRAGFLTPDNSSNALTRTGVGMENSLQSQPGCDGVGGRGGRGDGWVGVAMVAGGCDVVRGPVAGLGCRVGYILERDVVTGVVCDAVIAGAVKGLASRVSGAGFYLLHREGVTFQSKGDVVSISEPDGDLDKAALVLGAILGSCGVSRGVEETLKKVRHPGQIGLDELTVVIDSSEVIDVIRKCEPYIPDPGHGPYVIHSPSPVIPGLKIYLRSSSNLRVELVAHNDRQAFNAFFIRGEFVGDVLPHITRTPGIFDEWRAQYWHPYSHPIVINLDLASLNGAYHPRINSIRFTVEFKSLPATVQEAILDLRNKGMLYFNDFQMFMSKRLRWAYQKDPSNIMEQIKNCADPLREAIISLILQKTAVDYESLLEHLRSRRLAG